MSAPRATGTFVRVELSSVVQLDEEEANRISSIKPSSSWHKQSTKPSHASSRISGATRLSVAQSVVSSLNISAYIV